MILKFGIITSNSFFTVTMVVTSQLLNKIEVGKCSKTNILSINLYLTKKLFEHLHGQESMNSLAQNRPWGRRKQKVIT